MAQLSERGRNESRVLNSLEIQNFQNFHFFFPLRVLPVSYWRKGRKRFSSSHHIRLHISHLMSHRNGALQGRESRSRGISCPRGLQLLAHSSVSFFTFSLSFSVCLFSCGSKCTVLVLPIQLFVPVLARWSFSRSESNWHQPSNKSSTRSPSLFPWALYPLRIKHRI